MDRAVLGALGVQGGEVAGSGVVVEGAGGAHVPGRGEHMECWIATLALGARKRSAGSTPSGCPDASGGTHLTDAARREAG